MRRTISITVRIAILTAMLFVCFAVGSTIAGLTSDPEAAGDAGNTSAILLFVCLLQTLVTAYLVLRSRWHGTKLIAAILLIHYGVMTFMAQIESAVFITRLPEGTLPRLFLWGALISIPYSILAVLILGKLTKVEANEEGPFNSTFALGGWIWRLSLAATVYVVLYFTFGYYIAWRNPAVLEYYSGTDVGSFLAHMRTVLSDMPWLIPFQLLRGLIWVAIALPTIRMFSGRRWEASLAIGLAFAILMNALLLLPNPYMPEPVRMAHMVETASSNFIFGLFVGWLFTSDRERRSGHRDDGRAFQ
ncbi:MAG: hypothetical protein AB7F88_00295 [Pyrinomonadaceae bacterium]